MARHRLRRAVFIGVPRAVLDERARRGVAAAGVGATHAADADMHAFYGFQTHAVTA